MVNPHPDEVPGLAMLVNQAVRAHGAAVIVAADKAGIVPLLVSHPDGLDDAEVSDRLGLNPVVTAAVLPVLVEFGLLRAAAGRYRVTELAARHLDPARDTEYGGAWLRALHQAVGGPDGIGEYLRGKRELSAAMFEDVGVEVLSGLVAAYAPLGMADGTAFVRRMDLTGCRRVLDVGIGTAGYTIALLRAVPQARVVGVDLPQMLELVRGQVERAGLADRVKLVAANLFTDDLPGGGFDTVLVNNVFHNWDAEHRAVGLERLFRALDPGGTLYVSEHMRAESLPPGEGAVAALMGLLVLIKGGRGGAYLVGDHEAAARAAGFTDVHTVPLSGQAAASHVMSARKPWTTFRKG